MLNQKDSKDLITLEFPEFVLIRKKLVQSFNHLAMEVNKYMTRKLINRAGKIFNFAHYLFDHGDKYVHCDFSFRNKKINSNAAEMPQLPYHISYRCTNFHNHFQLTRICIK